MSGPGLVGLLCAGAVAPVVAAVGSAGLVAAAVAAVAGVAGSVGANVLTEVIGKAIGRLGGDGRQLPLGEVERELAAQLEAALGTGDERAQALRGEVAAVLREVDAVGAAVEAAVEAGDQRVVDELTAVLGTWVLSSPSSASCWWRCGRRPR